MTDTPDSSSPARAQTSATVDARLVWFVGLGGAAGTLARYVLTVLLPLDERLSVLLINVAGSLALGLIVAVCAGRLPRLQLLLGAGFCGGFTTYSALAVAVAEFAGAGDVFWALALALGTIAAAAAATVCGLWIGGALATRTGGAEL